MKTKKEKETIRMYVDADSTLIYFIKNGMEIGFLNLTGGNRIFVSYLPMSEETHKKHRTFIGEL